MLVTELPSLVMIYQSLVGNSSRVCTQSITDNLAYVLAAQNFNAVIATDDVNYIGFIVSSLLLGWVSPLLGGRESGSLAEPLSEVYQPLTAPIYLVDESLVSQNASPTLFSDLRIVTVAAAIFIVGGIIQTATQNKEMMMAGRFIGGIGIGQLVSSFTSLELALT